MGAAHAILVTMASMGECIECGTPIYGAEGLKKMRLKDQKTFYCINGHPQHYVGETPEQRLEKQLERAKKEKEWAEQDAKSAREARDTARRAESIAKGKLKAHSERVKNGVCPCCTRSFTNLRRHMAAKHPEWKGEEK